MWVPVKHVSKEQFFYKYYNFNLVQENWSSRRSVSGLSFSVMAELRILVKFILLYTRKFNNLKIYLGNISSHWFSSHYSTIVLFSTIHHDNFTIYIYIKTIHDMRWEYLRRYTSKAIYYDFLNVFRGSGSEKKENLFPRSLWSLMMSSSSSGDMLPLLMSGLR